MEFLRKVINSISRAGEKQGNLSSRTSALPDEKLIRLFVAERSDSAFEEIINRYGDKVYGLAYRITRDNHSAEEVLQEVFLTLVNKLDSFRGESKFSSWLFRVTANASYMHLRAGKKYENDYSLDNYAPYDQQGTLMGKIKSKDWSDTPDNVLFSKEAIGIIEKAVDELPEPYRIVFHLRDVEELSNEEVANILGLSVPAVKSRVHRARLFLRDKLSEYFYESRLGE